MSELDDLKALLARLVTRQDSLETAIRKLGGAPGPGSPYSIAPHRKATIIGTVPVNVYTTELAWSAAARHPVIVSPTWTKIISDYDVTHDGALIQLPNDGIYTVDIDATPTWPLSSLIHAPASLLVSVIDTGTCGALLLQSSSFGLRLQDLADVIKADATALSRGTALIQGNNVAIKTANAYMARPASPPQRPYTEIAPSKITVTCTIHELIAGSH